MYGGNNNLQERITDNWINQNIPGGVNSVAGEALDNIMGGNPNPTAGQVYGGLPGVGGIPPPYGQQFPGPF